MRPRDLPDISALTLGRRAYISGKSLVPMLQLSHVHMYIAIYVDFYSDSQIHLYWQSVSQ